MEVRRFGASQGKSVMLLHGNLMCWRQFEDLIPLLEETCCVYAVSFDGFGHGKIINHPELLARELKKILFCGADGR